MKKQRLGMTDATFQAQTNRFPTRNIPFDEGKQCFFPQKTDDLTREKQRFSPLKAASRRLSSDRFPHFPRYLPVSDKIRC